MLFKTFKELDTKIKEITSKSELQKDISVMSQGNEINFQYIGEGSTPDGKEMSFMGITTADSMRIKYTESGNTIIVHAVKVTRG